jgi:hypothetical protein
MKTLQEYIAESAEWMESPAEGDSFAFELPDEIICETYILEVADDCILLDSTPEINSALAEWAALEDTDDGDSGIIMETMGYGGLVGEGNIEDLEKNIASAAVKPIPMEEGAMKRQMMDNAERMTLEQFTDLYGDDEWVIEFWKYINEPNDIDEAEYRGRKVPLGKPMRGDVKKFKVYVKDPATGNVKKVNFGHGGTSAKRAGQKTMKIKKSNPARRKSFRARHNCANPGPRTKARYWSCRAW